jgi:hypothetical protein
MVSNAVVTLVPSSVTLWRWCFAVLLQSEQHRMRCVGSGSQLGCIYWRRVLLDESQRLGAGSSSGVCRAAAKLVAASKWCLSGELLWFAVAVHSHTPVCWMGQQQAMHSSLAFQRVAI